MKEVPVRTEQPPKQALPRAHHPARKGDDRLPRDVAHRLAERAPDRDGVAVLAPRRAVRVAVARVLRVRAGAARRAVRPVVVEVGGRRALLPRAHRRPVGRQALGHAVALVPRHVRVPDDGVRGDGRARAHRGALLGRAHAEGAELLELPNFEKATLASRAPPPKRAPASATSSS